GDLGLIVAAELDHEQGRRPAVHRPHCVAEREVAAGQVEEHLVDQFHRRGTQFQACAEGVHGRAEGGEVRHEEAAELWPRQQLQLCLTYDSQRTLTTDDKLMQADVSVGQAASLPTCPGQAGSLPYEHVEVVPADSPQDARKATANLIGRVADYLTHRGVEPP